MQIQLLSKEVRLDSHVCMGPGAKCVLVTLSRLVFQQLLTGLSTSQHSLLIESALQ